MQHDWRIDERQYRRHEDRRGRRHAYVALDPTRTALVVIDMVPFFTEANPYAAGIVPNVNALASALRRAGGTVAWVIPAEGLAPSNHLEFFGPAVAATYASSGGSGAPRDRIDPSLDVGDVDPVFEKSAASAFFPGRCDLDGRLQDDDVETVIVVGTLANVCCESSVRDANTLGYRVIMVADANAAGTDAELNATLHTVYRSFGDVRTTSEVVDLIAAD